MEADGIVEGFSKSIEMHGLKFNKLIGNSIPTHIVIDQFYNLYYYDEI